METPAAPPDTEPTPPDEPTTPPDDDDGNGGDAVERARREAAKHRRDLRAAQQANDELRAELERRRVENESEQERAIREAVEAERERLTGEFAGERLHNRLRIRAAGKLREPEDAVLHLGGQIAADADDKAIDEAIEALIAERDYLAAPNGGEPGVPGLVTQGGRSAPPGAGSRESSPDDWIRSRARSA